MDEEHSSSDDLLDGEEFNNNKDSDVPMDIEEEEDEVFTPHTFLSILYRSRMSLYGKYDKNQCRIISFIAFHLVLLAKSFF